ncbi:MAG: hypothetical protein R3F19_05160 [Verrucomicrobiales bacterium]
MKKWYFLLLVCTAVGGWFAYPHAYPKVTEFIESGELPWTGSGSAATESGADGDKADAVLAGSGSPIPGSSRRTRTPAKPPEFASIEEIVGNWKAIPATAFPRKTKLKKAVTYQISGGTGTLTAGTEVVALSSDRTGNLSVAPNETSSLRGLVAIDDTDFKAVLTDVYKKFQERKLAQFNAAQAEIAAQEPEEVNEPGIIDQPSHPDPGMATGANTPMPAKPVNLDAATRAIVGEPPLQYVDGTVPLMIRSMESGQVTEIKPEMITYWARIHYEKIDGAHYWVGRVDYTANSIFGIFPTQAKALMQNGKVIKWIYAGSEEPVP